MTRRQFERIFRLWQDRLGLDYWHIAIDWNTPARDDCDATTWRANDYDRAVLKLDPEWPGWEKRHGIEFVHRIIVHELLHLLTRDIDEVVGGVEKFVSKDVYSALDAQYDHEIEGLIDRLSYRIVGLAYE